MDIVVHSSFTWPHQRTDGSDYTGGPFEVTFPAGVNVVSFNVSILDDAIAECAKLFNLDLDIPEAAADMGVIRGSPDTATVHIMDDDGEWAHCFVRAYINMIGSHWALPHSCSWRSPPFHWKCWLYGEGECCIFCGCCCCLSSSRL